jgi:phosphoribosylformylglycinamidine synthase
VSHLRIPTLPQPWETTRELNPRMASALEIMIDGPLGGAAFNNEFGRPNLTGYFPQFRTGDRPARTDPRLRQTDHARRWSRRDGP